LLFTQDLILWNIDLFEPLLILDETFDICNDVSPVFVVSIDQVLDFKFYSAFQVFIRSETEQFGALRIGPVDVYGLLVFLCFKRLFFVGRASCSRSFYFVFGLLT
jgi:hypothetical protein